MLRGPLVVALLFAATAIPAQQDESEDPEGYQYLEASLVGESLEGVLSRPEFARLRAEPEQDEEETGSFEWLDRFLDWVASLLGGFESREPESSFSFGGRGLAYLLYGMAAVILVAALVFLGKAVLGSVRERKLVEEEGHKPLFGPGSAPGELDPAEYRSRAQGLAERGEYKIAIRELLLAAMSTLERRGLVRFRKGLTNRDYLRAARGATRMSLDTIVGNFEHVYFGRRDATAESYAECRRALEDGFPLETT